MREAPDLQDGAEDWGFQDRASGVRPPRMYERLENNDPRLKNNNTSL